MGEEAGLLQGQEGLEGMTMWWIIGALCLFAVIVCFGACKVSGECSREEEERVRSTMIIRCCKGCVAPKRYPGCHDHCSEYISERAEYDKRMEEERKIKSVNYAVAVGAVGQCPDGDPLIQPFSGGGQIFFPAFSSGGKGSLKQTVYIGTVISKIDIAGTQKFFDLFL